MHIALSLSIYIYIYGTCIVQGCSNSRALAMELLQPCAKPSIRTSPSLLAGHPLQWPHNGCDGVSNHQRLDCLLNRLFRSRSKKTPKLRVTGLYEGNSSVTDELASQGAVALKMFPFNDVIMQPDQEQCNVRHTYFDVSPAVGDLGWLFCTKWNHVI